MQKILTALDNQEFYDKIKSIKDFYVYEKDIQYKEGIIDILKIKPNFDILIIYEKLLGEISIEKLIQKIKLINNKIKIIFILENKNEELEKILINENIKNIFYNDEINFENFINKIIYSEEEILKKEIDKLNKIIYDKNKELKKYKEDSFKNNNLNIVKKSKNKIIIISDVNIYEKLKKDFINKLRQRYRIIYLNINNLNNKKIGNGNFIFILNNNVNEIKKYKNMIDLIKIKKSMNLNIVFIENKNKINLKILKSIFKRYKILGEIKIDKNNQYNINEKLIRKI